MKGLFQTFITFAGMLAQIVFVATLFFTIALFYRSVRRIRRAILLGRKEVKNDHKKQRWKNVLLIAFGQKKMFKRPFPALLHLCVYLGFLIINIEIIEILIDGIFGTHRFLAPFLGLFYNVITLGAEVFMLLVFIACTIFLIRRYSGRVERFEKPEMRGWPRIDAAIILWTEIALVVALFIMNAADQVLQQRQVAPYHKAGFFPFSQFLIPFFSELPTQTLILTERSAWWAHILGVFAFLNYIPYSKHLHIFLAFPNTYYSDTGIVPLGKFAIDENVKKEVEAILKEQFDESAEETPPSFGAKDVFDLSWIDLLGAFTCTECGRCTAVCPANITGKKLSPRKIMMDVRDRCEMIVNVIEEKGEWEPDGKTLWDFISEEEVWACTTCNACAEECPVNINPVRIIMQLRQYKVMEESKVPEPWMAMFNNIENNGAPWPFAAADRFKWAEKITEE